MGLLARLDVYGTNDPDFNEGHPEDRCPLCDRPVCDHPVASAVAMAFGPAGQAYPARWPHRWHALIAILFQL